MFRDATRSRRALTAACVLLLSVSAAHATRSFAPPPPRGLAHAEINAGGDSDAAGSQQLSEHRHLIEGDASVAPRVAEARASLALCSLESSQPTPRCELAAHGREDRLASRSGCAATTRWCRAHATSTQEP